LDLTRAAAAGSLTLLLISPLAAQLGGEVTGDSAQRAAMAGAGMAGAGSAVDAAVNPASLGFLFPEGGERSSGRFDGYGRLVWAPTTVETAAGRDYPVGGTLGGGPFLGYAAPVGGEAFLGISLLPTAGGQAAYDRMTELNVATSNNTGPPWIPAKHEVEIESNLVQLGLEPAFAWRPSDAVSFGVGASLRYTTLSMKSATDVGLDQLTGEVPGLGGLTWEDLFRQLAASGGREIDSIQADIDAEAEAALHAFLQLGVMLEPGDDTRLSFWYRSPSTSNDLDGDVRVDVTADVGPILDIYGLKGITDFSLNIPSVRFPQQIGGAWMQRFGDQDRLFADLVWTDWSQTFDGWIATVSDPQGGDIGGMLGGGETTVDLGLDWTDTVRMSLGWEHDLFRRKVVKDEEGRAQALISGTLLTWRGGLAYSNNPVSGSPMAGMLPINQLHAAGGCTFWGRRGGGDWHLALVVALPQSWTAGDNTVLADLSGDQFHQANVALVAGYTLNW